MYLKVEGSPLPLPPFMVYSDICSMQSSQGLGMQRVIVLLVVNCWDKKFRTWKPLKPCPNHQRWHAKWKLSRNMYTLQTSFCTFGANLHAQSVIIDKISGGGAQSEVLLRVRCWLGTMKNHSTNPTTWDSCAAGLPTVFCSCFPPLHSGTFRKKKRDKIHSVLF